jgi:hypothetical protein
VELTSNRAPQISQSLAKLDFVYVMHGLLDWCCITYLLEKKLPFALGYCYLPRLSSLRWTGCCYCFRFSSRSHCTAVAAEAKEEDAPFPRPSPVQIVVWWVYSSLGSAQLSQHLGETALVMDPLTSGYVC